MRVLSIHPGLTELAFSLGAGDLLVGRTDSCTHPENALKTPSIGPQDEVSEVLVDVFEPNIVLTGPGQEEFAKQLGKKYLVVSFNPQNFETLFAAIKHLGDLLHKNVEAEMLIHDMRLALDELKEHAERYKTVRTYVEVAHRPPQSANGYISELVRMAGGTCYTGEVTPEDIGEFDPQYILSCVPDEEEFNFELLTSREGWSDLNAVRHERLFCLPCWMLHRPGPRMLKGIAEVGKILHGIRIENGN